MDRYELSVGQVCVSHTVHLLKLHYKERHSAEEQSKDSFHQFSLFLSSVLVICNSGNFPFLLQEETLHSVFAQIRIITEIYKTNTFKPL